MKRKLIIYLFLGVFFLGVKEAKSQIRRTDWYGSPILGFDNPAYFVGSYVIANFVSKFGTPQSLDERFDSEADALKWMARKLWYIPQWRYRANIVQNMEFDTGKASIRPSGWGWNGLDWFFRNYSIGYRVGYMSRIFPLGFEIEADFVQDGYKVKMPWSEKSESMIKRMISTTALTRIRFMSYDKWACNPFIELGGSYNYALHYHDGLVNDKDAVNNGFTGIAGVGVVFTDAHFAVNFRYEQSFYDFHNDNYEYKGKKIYSGAKSKFGNLSLLFSVSL